MIKEVIKKYTFKTKKYLHYKKYKLTPSLTQDTEILYTLDRDGIFVLENFIDEASVTKIQQELKPHLEKLSHYENSEPGKHFVKPEYGVYRLFQIDKFSETANSLFFTNEFINNIAKAYVSPEVKSYLRFTELKGRLGKFSVADIFHFDDWRHRFKAFLYLCEVDLTSCPFVYVPGSHKSDKWRSRKELEYYIYGKNGSYGYFLPHEIENLFKNKGFQPLIVTAPAGSLILVDTRGLHRGSPSTGKERLLLANFFDVRQKTPQ